MFVEGKEVFFLLKYKDGPSKALCGQYGPTINHFTTVENFQYCIALEGYPSYYNWIAPCPACENVLGFNLLQE